MTQTILGALRYKGANVTEDLDQYNQFSSRLILLPVASYFYYALTPHLLSDEYLTDKELMLVQDCPSFCFTTKISLGDTVSIESCKEVIGKLQRFVRVVARKGSSHNEELLALLIRCPFLQEVRFRSAGNSFFEVVEKISCLQSAAFVAKKHPHPLVRAFATRDLGAQFLSYLDASDDDEREVIESVFSLIVTPTPDASLTSSPTMNHIYNLFNIAKKNFVRCGTTGSMEVFTHYIVFFTQWIQSARKHPSTNGLGEQRQQHGSNNSINNDDDIDDDDDTNPLRGFGGVYADFAEIFDTIEVLIDSGDFKRLSVHQYGCLLRLAKELIILKHSSMPDSCRVFFWQVWNEHRDSIFVPLLDHAPIIETREHLRSILSHWEWRREFFANPYGFDAELDRYDCCGAYLFMYNMLVPDLYWYDCSKSGATDINSAPEGERLRVEDFTEMVTSGKRKFSSHIPFDRLFRIWDLLEEDDDYRLQRRNSNNCVESSSVQEINNNANTADSTRQCHSSSSVRAREAGDDHHQQQDSLTTVITTSPRVSIAATCLRNMATEIENKLARKGINSDNRNNNISTNDSEHKVLEFREQFKVKEALRSDITLEGIFNSTLRFYGAKGFVELGCTDTDDREKDQQEEQQQQAGGTMIAASSASSPSSSSILFASNGALYCRLVDSLLWSSFRRMTKNPYTVTADGFQTVDWNRLARVLSAFHQGGIFAAAAATTVANDNESVVKRFELLEYFSMMKTKMVESICEVIEIAMLGDSLKNKLMMLRNLAIINSETVRYSSGADDQVDWNADEIDQIDELCDNFASETDSAIFCASEFGRRILQWLEEMDKHHHHGQKNKDEKIRPICETDDAGENRGWFMQGSAFVERNWYIKHYLEILKKEET